MHRELPWFLWRKSNHLLQSKYRTSVGVGYDFEMQEFQIFFPSNLTTSIISDLGRVSMLHFPTP